MKTGDWIRKLRAEQKMSQQELADRAEVSFSFVNQAEGGKQTLRLDILNKLLAVFGYEMSPRKIVNSPKFETDLQVSRPVTIHRPKNDWSFFD